MIVGGGGWLMFNLGTLVEDMLRIGLTNSVFNCFVAVLDSVEL